MSYTLPLFTLITKIFNLNLLNLYFMKLTAEQKEANKLARAEARAEARRIAKIEKEKNQKPVKEIRFSIEWKKSRMWGYNPHLVAECYHKDGTYTRVEAKASGCGYDKESQVIADAFNVLLKYKLYEHDEVNEDKMPYGVRIGSYKGYSGGIGVSCYYSICEFIGGKFEKVASGKTYDAYKYIDLS
jgi:hypothetical protein